jgi:hypothetical protein
MKTLSVFLPAAALAILATQPRARGASLYSDPADAMLEGRGSTLAGPLDPTWPQVHPDTNGGWQLTAGEWYGAGPDGPGAYGLTAIVLPFQLPDLGAVVDPFTSASLGVNLNPNTGDANSTPIDLYGLQRISSSPAVLPGDWYRGASPDPTATLIQASFLTPASPQSWGAPNNFTDPAGDAGLLSFMNAAYAGGVGANQFIFLRLNYSSDTFATGQDNYNINVAESDPGGGNPNAEDPVINYTAIPEPATAVLLLVGSTLALGFRSSRNTNRV